jgi:hypothetical protein
MYIYYYIIYIYILSEKIRNMSDKMPGGLPHRISKTYMSDKTPDTMSEKMQKPPNQRLERMPATMSDSISHTM